MSQTFDIKRYGRLVRHDVRSCPRETLYSGLWMALAFAPLMVLSQQGGNRQTYVARSGYCNLVVFHVFIFY